MKMNLLRSSGVPFTSRTGARMGKQDKRIQKTLRPVRVLCLSMLLLCASAISSAQPTFTEYPVPTTGSGVLGIAAGPEGALWFTEAVSNKIGRITIAGATTEFVVPTSNSSPHGIIAGSDGALWFAEYAGNKIGRITTGGAITEFPVP